MRFLNIDDPNIKDYITEIIDINDDGCWTINKIGNQIYLIDPGKAIDLHRASYILFVNKNLKRNNSVERKCNNKNCVNPDHLCLGPHKKKKSVDKIKKKFETNFDKTCGCWEWKGGLDIDGYGIFGCHINGQKLTNAHRTSYTFYKGNFDSTLQILHKCNNKKCVNPDHLYAGTHQNNMRDLRDAGTLKGKNNPNYGVKCTDEKREKLRSAAIKQFKNIDYRNNIIEKLSKWYLFTDSDNNTFEIKNMGK